MTPKLLIPITLVLVLFGCKSWRSSENYYCSYQEEIPASKLKDQIEKQKDSCATLSIEIIKGVDYEEGFNFGRLISIPKDSSVFKELDNGMVSFRQPKGYYKLELRMFYDRIYVDSFYLNAFEHRKLIIDPGKPSCYVTYEGKSKRKQ